MSSYIGVEPSTSFTGLIKQDFSVSATTSYTLSHSVNNANDIALYINFVRQEPTTAYSCSGTSLTLTSATAGSDDMYCIYLGQALQTVNPSNASVGNSQVAPSIITGQTNENTANDSDTILVYDDSATALRKQTRANFLSGVGGANTPSFHARTTGSQSISNNSFTKIQFTVEEYDNGGVYDNSSNYRFTPTETGKFIIYGQVGIESINSAKYFTLRIYQNGSPFTTPVASHTGTNGDQRFNFIFGINNTSSTDYYEVYIFHNHGSSRDANDCRFGAYKIIE